LKRNADRIQGGLTELGLARRATGGTQVSEVADENLGEFKPANLATKLHENAWDRVVARLFSAMHDSVAALG
jgi:hypothetical protein